MSGHRPPSPGVVHAVRGDGLGQRLCVLVNAFALARMCNVPFQFRWPPQLAVDPSVDANAHHTVGAAEALFSPAFLRSHHRPDAREGTFLRLGGELETVDEVRDALVNQGRSLLIREETLDALWRDVSEPTVSDHFRLAFRSIEFAEPLERARAAALLAPLGDGPSAAVHMRAGDIIYGPYRYSNTMTGKAVPLQLAYELVVRQRQEGRNVVLFGQDKDALDWLAEQTGATVSSALLPDESFDSYQRAVFDIAVMARCEVILAANSGFAVIAARTSDAQLVDSRKVVSPRELARISSDSPALSTQDQRVSGLQRAFAYWYLARMAPNALSQEQRLTVLHKARRHDQENDFYALVEACLLEELGKTQEADALLMERVEHHSREDLQSSTIVAMLLQATSSGRSRHAEYLPGLVRMADAGRPAAAFCAALVLSVEDPEEARALAIRSRASLPSTAWGAQAGSIMDGIARHETG